MSAVLVGHAVGVSFDSGTTATAAIADTSAANFLALAFTGLTGSPSVADDQGNTWIPLTPQINATSGARNQIFYVENPIVTAGTQLFLVGAVASFPSVQVWAFSGMATSGVFLSENGEDTGGAATTIQTGAVDPSPNNGAVILTGLYNNDGSGTPTIDGGFTISDYTDQIPAQSFGSAGAYLIQGAAASANPTWTKGLNFSAATIAAFKAAGAAGNARYYYAQQ